MYSFVLCPALGWRDVRIQGPITQFVSVYICTSLVVFSVQTFFLDGILHYRLIN